MLEQKAVLELQNILVTEHNKNLPLEEVEKIGKRLINLYQTLLGSEKIKINNHAIKKPQSLHRA